VAPKRVPQMADSEIVVKALSLQAAAGLERPGSSARPASSPRRPSGLVRGFSRYAAGEAKPSKELGGEPLELIGIVVNDQGLDRALATPGVTTLGYPYSVSANFRRSNANLSLAESRALAEKLKWATDAAGRGLVVYISMAFGNHYGEPWSPEVVEEAVMWLAELGVPMVSLADTVGSATPEEVSSLFRAMVRALKGAGGGVELGVHLHSRPDAAVEKVLAAYEAGCRRFDCALTGLGGCPFAGDHLVGNIPTEIVVSTLAARGAETGLEPWALLSAVEATKEIRRHYA
jgi:hydroxymethylglutaryl-CoA lyase